MTMESVQLGPRHDPGAARERAPVAEARSEASSAPIVVEVEELRKRGPAWLSANPLVLEIGFGRGELLLEVAAERSDRGFLGLEISRKRVRKMERRVARAELENVHLVHAPAQYVLERVLPAGSLAECWIHCPDPWPKRRHHGRRLIQPAVAALLVRVLAPGGRLRLSTDDLPYAEWMQKVFSAQPALVNRASSGAWSWQAPERRRTGYEEDWIADGRRIAYFDYECRVPLAPSGSPEAPCPEVADAEVPDPEVPDPEVRT